MASFKSFEALAEEIALELLEGRVIVLVGLPRSGRSSIARHVQGHCGGSAVAVEGRRVTDQNYRTTLRTVEGEVSTRLTDGGTAQVIVDDFGPIVRSSFGHRFQAALRALVVDSENADQIGCMVCTSLSDPLSAVGRRGSPLTAVGHHRFVPWLTEMDVDGVNTRGAYARPEVMEACGSNASLLDRYTDAGPAAAVAYAASAADRWIADLSSSDIEALDVACGATVPYDPLVHDRLAPLLHRSSAGVATIGLLPCARIAASKLGPWPETHAASVQRFAARLGRESDALWVDRYLCQHPQPLSRFLTDLASTSSAARLRLLTTRRGAAALSPNDLSSLRAAIATADASGLAVEIRVASFADVQALHARQLLLPTSSLGFNLPPCDRVLGQIPMGNEVDSEVSDLNPVALAEAAWRRASPLLP